MWTRIVVWVPVVFSWYGAYQQLCLRNPFGNNPAPDWMMLVLLLVLGVLFPLFLFPQNDHRSLKRWSVCSFSSFSFFF
ncbi:hypothetical protein [Methanosarcina lacustris]|uniref:hypothetical protein n=1 Tax=Methanosarcina lacustris TaxID=170861 RepID=UPI001E392F51|nr:hypothetical protein [Methanosarcina lacustris]